MINEELARKTLNMEIEAGKKLSKFIIAQLKNLMNEANKAGGLDKLLKSKGSEVKLKNLVNKGQLEEQVVTDVELKTLKKELNKNGVKFSVMKDKESGNHSVFFQAKDAKVMERAFKNTLSKIDKKKERKESLKKNLEKFKEVSKNTVSKDRVKNKKQEKER